MSFLPFGDILQGLWSFYQVFVQFNGTYENVFMTMFTFLYELLFYIPISFFDQIYTFFSMLYTTLYGLISFAQGIFNVVTLIRSGYWPSGMSSMITYLFFLSIGIANSRLIFNIVLRIYRLIPFVGGR